MKTFFVCTIHSDQRKLLNRLTLYTSSNREKIPRWSWLRSESCCMMDSSSSKTTALSGSCVLGGCPAFPVLQHEFTMHRQSAERLPNGFRPKGQTIKGYFKKWNPPSISCPTSHPWDTAARSTGVYPNGDLLWGKRRGSKPCLKLCILSATHYYGFHRLCNVTSKSLLPAGQLISESQQSGKTVFIDLLIKTTGSADCYHFYNGCCSQTGTELFPYN